jgi:hypothetical protein
MCVADGRSTEILMGDGDGQPASSRLSLSLRRAGPTAAPWNEKPQPD